MKIKFIFLFVFLSAGFNFIKASHNLAGEITYRQVGAKSILASINTFSDGLSPADRDSLRICWGDGECEYLIRVNGIDENMNGVPDGVLVENDYRYNLYVGQHEYDNLGTYTLSMADPNRQGDILNVNYPQSDMINFFLETDVYLSMDKNDSPVLYERPLDVGFINSPFIHIPNAFDEEGDRIEYALIPPLMNNGLDALNYVNVDQIMPGANNTISIDSETGLILWDSPQIAGAYVIAVEIKTYRNGVLNGRIIRDMQIEVAEDENLLPNISHNKPSSDLVIEVQAEETIDLVIVGDDEGNNGAINLSSSSPLYSRSSMPAVFNMNGLPGYGDFKWTVTEELVREEPYQIVFQCTDSLGYANFALFRYKVVSSTNIKSAQKLNEQIKVFPNPVANVLNIVLKESKLIDYQLLNYNSEIVREGKVDYYGRLSLEGLNNGIYLLKFSNGAYKLIFKN